jgi:hypothetical protein
MGKAGIVMGGRKFIHPGDISGQLRCGGEAMREERRGEEGRREKREKKKKRDEERINTPGERGYKKGKDERG